MGSRSPGSATFSPESGEDPRTSSSARALKILSVLWKVARVYA